MLIDDSPRKAALQPWNHLCIKEYAAEIRSSDLIVANWEAARRRLHHARETLELERRQMLEMKEEAERIRQEDEKLMKDARENPENTKVIREVAMVNGKMVGQEHLVKKVLKEVVMVEGQLVGNDESLGLSAEDTKLSTKNRKRKQKRVAKKEAMLKANEENSLESAKALRAAEMEEGEIDTVELTQEHESEEIRLEALAPEMKYDETILAVIGVLDHIKHESSVAGWMRHGGLLKLDVAEDVSRLSKYPDGSPAKKRKLDPTDSFNHTPSSPATLPPPSSPSHPNEHPPSSTPTSPSHRTEERAEEAETGVPLTFSDPSREPLPSPSLWFERPDVMMYWADRGRRALQELNIPAESGVIPV